MKKEIGIVGRVGADESVTADTLAEQLIGRYGQKGRSFGGGFRAIKDGYSVDANGDPITAVNGAPVLKSKKVLVP